MAIPAALLQELCMHPGFDAEAFLQAHDQQRPPVSIRYNPHKPSHNAAIESLITRQVPWCSKGYYLQERPAFAMDPFWHAGSYYVQEASSMIIEAVWKQYCQSTDKKLILDLCAAPGGKSTHLLSLLQENDVLVSNEVIKNRLPVLLENITRWGNANSIVTNNDPRQIGQLNECFDIMLIDAPCSGSGLFRREPEAIKHWSEDAVQTCALRQKRILADALPALKKQGILIYATCSFSVAEDEAIVDWLTSAFPLEALPLEVPEEWGWIGNSQNNNGTGYRAFPHKLDGEGFFMAVFRKTNDMSEAPQSGSYYRQLPTNRQPKQPAEAQQLIRDEEEGEWFTHNDKWWFMPFHSARAVDMLRPLLNIKKAGVLVGSREGASGKWQPHHELALSQLLQPGVARVELSLRDALQYLQGQTLTVDNVSKGFICCSYGGLPLGWGKNIGTRINNLLPKEWRLRKLS